MTQSIHTWGKNGWTLWVAIADGAYMTENSHLIKRQLSVGPLSIFQVK